MKADIQTLKHEMAKVKDELRVLSSSSLSMEVVQWRSIPDSQAKDELRALFSRGEMIYISEASERLNLPDEQVLNLCLQLQQEGVINTHDDLPRSGR